MHCECFQFYLNFVRGDCSSSFDRKLANCCRGPTQEILPVDLVNVGALGVSVAGILLSSELSVVRILELDHKSFDRFPRLFDSNQHTSAAIGEPV